MNFAGQVLRQDGTPATGACIEIWHADGNGDYDHHSFNTRGHQFTDGNGEFLFETTKPSGYGTHSMSLIGTIDFRSAHIHVKIRTGGDTFTTQVWFPDDPRNATDVAYWAFKNSNVVSYDDDAPTLTARFKLRGLTASPRNLGRTGHVPRQVGGSHPWMTAPTKG